MTEQRHEDRESHEGITQELGMPGRTQHGSRDDLGPPPPTDVDQA